MKIEGDGQRLRIYCNQDDTHEGKPLHEALVELAQERKLAGATVFRGIAGYGARPSGPSPMVVEIVDRDGKIQPLIAQLERMLSKGMIVTVEPVRFITYRDTP